jgi:hypothetical protein
VLDAIIADIICYALERPTWPSNTCSTILYAETTVRGSQVDDDQLKPLVDRLAPFLADNLTDQMQFAIASIARSIVTDETIAGRGVHYARAKDPYRLPKLYRDGDPRFTWYSLTRAVDALLRAGLNRAHHTGFQSVAGATDEPCR